ncbi:MAG: HIT family protein [Chlamydiales bacterium]|nr:HIT family protein [Chlamydiales bacterium]
MSLVTEPKACVAYFDENAYLDNGVSLTHTAKQNLKDYSKLDHEKQFKQIHAIKQIWKDKQVKTKDFLVYALEDKESRFKWQLLPFNSDKYAFLQQLTVLFHLFFPREAEGSIKEGSLIQDWPIQTQGFKIESSAVVGNDVFCNQKIVQKQRVYEGNTVELLYNYAPLGFGSDQEKLHFLIIPKKHKDRFEKLSLEEYTEAMEVAQKLSAFLEKEKHCAQVHLFHKNGASVGMTVPHWHLHVVGVVNAKESFLGKLAVLRNMLLGSFALKDSELKEKVERYQKEWKSYLLLNERKNEGAL